MTLTIFSRTFSKVNAEWRRRQEAQVTALQPSWQILTLLATSSLGYYFSRFRLWRMGRQPVRHIPLKRFGDRAIIIIAGDRSAKGHRSHMGIWRQISGWFGRLVRMAGHGSEFLCDTCRYDHGNACRRPERPNARRCPDYRRN